MRFTFKMLAIILVMGMVNLVMAAATTQPSDKKADQVSGKIVRVEGTNVIVSASKKDGTKDKIEVTVQTDAQTKITIDGQPKNLGDLTAGLKVTVKPAVGFATEIKAKTAAAKSSKKNPSGTPAP